MRWLSDAQLAQLVEAQRQTERPAVALPDDDGQPIVLAIGMNARGARELLAFLNERANTLEPKRWPSWLAGWFKKLEALS